MTDDDLVKAREAERVMREYAAHPSSFTVPDSEQARSVADTIAALLDERDALAREVDACAAALPGPYYMDPPDGGDYATESAMNEYTRRELTASPRSGESEGSTSCADGTSARDRVMVRSGCGRRLRVGRAAARTPGVRDHSHNRGSARENPTTLRTDRRECRASSDLGGETA